MMNDEIKLICTPLRFYTQNDEDLLFEWLKKIQSIKQIKGIGRELHLSFDTKEISNYELRDLFGIFDRYKFEKKQLQIFKNEQNKELFKKIK